MRTPLLPISVTLNSVSGNDAALELCFSPVIIW